MADDSLPPAVRCDLPDWLHARLVSQFGADETLALARALNQPAPLDLRVNTIRTDRPAVLERLAADGIAAEPGPLSPLAVRLRGKPALVNYPLFVDGSVEVQDAGSQLLGFLLEPKRGEMVVDFCAGAGGKTLLLGALMRNTGRLYAFDVSDKRLAKLKPRLARSGLSNVHPARIEHERDQKVKRLAGKVDRVLVDAPCSGLGTLRRNPDLKWRQDEASVAELAAKQAAILESAARLVKPGGRLVYATCSLLADENDAIVDAFLARNPAFRVVPAADILGRQGIALDGERLRLLPHLHDSDGFFAAALERTA
jgi:16S rRNA (cytosine967-C5)-methyltransferase